MNFASSFFLVQKEERQLDNEGATAHLRAEDGWRSPSNSRPNSGSFSPTCPQRKWIDVITGTLFFCLLSRV